MRLHETTGDEDRTSHAATCHSACGHLPQLHNMDLVPPKKMESTIGVPCAYLGSGQCVAVDACSAVASMACAVVASGFYYYQELNS